MKSFVYLIYIIVLLISAINSYALDVNKKNWNIDIYTEPAIDNPQSYFVKNVDHIKIKEMPKELAKHYYDDINVYYPEIYTYDDNFIMIYKSFIPSANVELNEDIVISIYKNHYLYEIKNNFDEICKKLLTLQTSTINKKFECTVYDVSKYAKKYDFDSKFLTIVKLENEIIWYGAGNRLGDVKEISRNEYIVSALDWTYYIHIYDGIKIIEQFTLPFAYGNSAHTGIRDPFPILCDILTDNIIRLEYKDGAVEHWKVRLSKEDVEKNMEAAKKAGLSEGKIINSKRNSLLWWNGMGKGSPTGMTINIESGGKETLIMNKKNVKIWNYDDNPTREPVYENML